jgi:hypothetical protein
MRISLYHTYLLATFAIFAVPGTVMAQDAGMSDVEVVDYREAEGEKILLSPGGEGEVRYIPKAASSIRKDSVSVQAEGTSQKPRIEPAAKPTTKQPAKEDESILTFNFLYYIIQKYKLQDIVD